MSKHDLVEHHTSIDQLALDTWGGEDQIFMLIEEMSELAQAISKRKRGLEHNIAEEIADVEIMLSQVKMYLDLGEEIYKWKNFKYERMRKVLEKHE
jgi:NTP pyrophosphatase (non-canonical NTP hydrolase)